MLGYGVSTDSVSAFNAFYAGMRGCNSVSFVENPQKSQDLPNPILHQHSLSIFTFGRHNLLVSNRTQTNS
jgi:hypothetical protein